MVKKRSSLRGRRRKSTYKKRTQRKKSMYGGNQRRRSYGRLPALNTGQRQNRNSFNTKSVLPRINSNTNTWQDRRKTFVENVDYKNRRRSGQFHYPTKKSSPWQKIKNLFIKDKKPYPPVFY